MITLEQIKEVLTKWNIPEDLGFRHKLATALYKLIKENQ